MAKLENLGEVISADLLVVGGGLGGLVAAIKAKEERPKLDVLIVEKQTVGFSGKAPKGGGILTFISPDTDPDKYAEYQIKNIGYYLNNQDLLYAYARESFNDLKQLMEWGVNVAKDANGKLFCSNRYAQKHAKQEPNL
jgi:succinate dehydrogenase / fumarate reductase flavoprotein subunit